MQATATSGTAVVGYEVDCLCDGYCDNNNECASDSCSGIYECLFTAVASGVLDIA